jgi:phage tail-like protein
LRPVSTTDGYGSRLVAAEKRGFTSKVRLRISDENTPPVVSARGYMRKSLPAVYQDAGFGVRFIGALETLFDPIVGTLDALPAYFDPDLAPRDILELLAAWLGMTSDESWPDERRREALRRAAELGRRRGTRSGLELALGIAFPDLPLRVEDGGKVTWSTDPDAPPEAGSGELVVYCDKPIDEPEQAAVARVIEQAKPLHVSYRLRVRAPRKSTNGGAR